MPRAVGTEPSHRLEVSDFLSNLDTGIVQEERVACLVAHVKAQPEDERNVDDFMRSFGPIKESLAALSNQWSMVLTVHALQLLCDFLEMLLRFVATTAPGYVGCFAERQDFNSTMVDETMVIASQVNFPTTLWPLLLCACSVALTNSRLDGVPKELTSDFIFSLVERAAFASEYSRLSLRVRVMGVEITTTRAVGLSVTVAGTLVTSFLHEFVQDGVKQMQQSLTTAYYHTAESGLGLSSW